MVPPLDNKYYILSEQGVTNLVYHYSQLRENLKENIGNATVIMVAQRISTIVDADRILVVEDGQIVGNGTHKELLENCPLYREIGEIQLGKEIH